jgi:hypothetical protein
MGVAASEAWLISETEATNRVLSAYPGILRNARLFGTVEATLRSDVPGFAKNGDKVWHVIITCDKGGHPPLFFVHPQSGQVYAHPKPGAKDSVTCQ